MSATSKVIGAAERARFLREQVRAEEKPETGVMSIYIADEFITDVSDLSDGAVMLADIRRGVSAAINRWEKRKKGARS